MPRRKPHQSPSSKVAQPRQERSRASMDRMLEATEALLGERQFEDISVTDIVRRARTSVGAFYNRFGEKDAVLPYLIERHYQAQLQTTEEAFSADCWGEVDLTQRLRLIVEGAVEAMRARRGLYRAIYVRLITRPQDITKDELQAHETVVRRVLDWLLEREREITRPDPGKSLRYALLQCYSMLNTAILNQSATDMESFTDDELRDMALESMLRFLGAGSPAPKRRRTQRSRTREKKT